MTLDTYFRLLRVLFSSDSLSLNLNITIASLLLSINSSLVYPLLIVRIRLSRN